MKKYLYLVKMSIKSNLVYIHDFIINNIFLLLMVIIYIFLWKKIYDSNVNFTYTYDQLLWYLIIAQMIFLGNGPLFRHVSSDIKTGDIIYYVNKPYSYPIYIFLFYFGRNLLTLIVNILLGSIAGIILIGKLPGFNIINIFPMAFLIILGVSINLLIYILISLTSFWFEENKAFTQLYQSIVYTFGGLLIPITFFPKFLQDISIYMPWTYISFHVSNACVNFNKDTFLYTLVPQIIYILVLILLINIFYKRGLRSLNANGG